MHELQKEPESSQDFTKFCSDILTNTKCLIPYPICFLQVFKQVDLIFAGKCPQNLVTAKIFFGFSYNSNWFDEKLWQNER